MNRIIVLGLAVLVGAGVAFHVWAGAHEGLAPQIEARVSKQALGRLWPGFSPVAVPLAIFDGERTWVFRHPKDLLSYRRGRDGHQIREGRDPAIIANSNAELEGVGTATLLLDNTSSLRSVNELAAVAVHEAFHVFQRKRHPTWTANEAELFTYPVDNPSLLAIRREETLSLRNALAAQTASRRDCWTRGALLIRKKRFSGLSAEHIAYERASELNEGLATYVERLVSRAPASLPVKDFPATQVRQRTYVTGAALAFLLDRRRADWKAVLTADDELHLDELLQASVGDGAVCQIDTANRGTLAVQARSEVAALAAGRAARLATFTQAPGWRVIVIADEAPLWPQGFDPLNVELVAPGKLLHGRFVKLGNDRGNVEVLGRSALSDAAGEHPLFQGVRRLEVAVGGKPQVSVDGNRTVLIGEGFRLTFNDVQVSDDDHVVTVRLLPDKPAPSSSRDTNRADARPVEPRAGSDFVKGVELYSWRKPKAGAWKFVLLPGTNRNKTPEEIVESAAALTSVSELKEQIESFAPGTTVVWIDTHDPISMPDPGLVQEVQASAAKAGIEVELVTR